MMKQAFTKLFMLYVLLFCLLLNYEVVRFGKEYDFPSTCESDFSLEQISIKMIEMMTSH